ncbi:MAG: flagellar biosynthesis protein FliQ [Clostridiales bacterium]
MAQGDVISILREALWTIMKLAAPLLLTSLTLGLIIAVFQAATQIHEQTLTFVPKILAIALLMILIGPWMMTNLTDFFMYICMQMLEI